MQFNYVYQSLFLWREIIGNMFKLWYLRFVLEIIFVVGDFLFSFLFYSELDLFSVTDCPYNLEDTGS